ncbi:MAG: hypothetical protein SAL70_36280 [Scytonema sp. PMC 1070.18]|nr:hypothetical protein [Scytonema sp. PMC 1070.18]
MDYRLEKLIIRQIEMVEILQDRTDEVLDWRTSHENAETAVAYLEALEYALEGLEKLSKFSQEKKEWKSEVEDEGGFSDRNLRDEFRISDRSRDNRDDNENRRR